MKARWKWANQASEYQAIERLRQKMFFPQAAVKPPLWSEYDDLCEHVIVTNENNEVTGSFRTRICDEETTECNVSHYYQMDELLQSAGTKMEVGRLCLDENHRQSAPLLFQALSEVIHLKKVSRVFGCVSIVEPEPEQKDAIFLAVAEQNRLSAGSPFNIIALNVYAQDSRKTMVPALKKSVTRLPALLRFYLKAGAEILGVPAYDSDLNSIDFFMTLDCSKLNAHFKRS